MAKDARFSLPPWRRLLRFFADALFAKRHGQRAIVLVTVAPYPEHAGSAP